MTAVALVAIAAVAFVVVKMRSKPTGPEPKVVHVPRAGEPVKIDGDLDEPSWQTSARRLFVKQDGTEAKPYSDIRLTWSDGVLHVGLYASDHDIVTAHVPVDGPIWRGDDFHVVFTQGKKQWAIDVDPKCTITDGTREDEGRWDYAWQSGARAACDADGTIDQPGDNDEEWVVEMDVPLAALGMSKSGDRTDLVVRRCDLKEPGGKPLESPCPQIEPITLVLD